MSVDKLLLTMSKVPEVQGLLKTFKKDKQYAIDLDEIMLAVTNAHTTRPIRRLTTKSVLRSSNNLLEANLVEQQTRSNMTERLMHISRIEGQLTTYMDRVRDLLMLKFGPKLAVFRSKEDKVRVIDQGLFSDLHHFLSRLDATRSYILMVIEDIDQSSYSLQRNVNILEYTSPARSKERTL